MEILEPLKLKENTLNRIYKLIPQRLPFLFIDKITSCNNISIQTELNLTGDEYFFKGHFPNNPIMPGVLLCEACFQSAAALLSDSGEKLLGVVTKIEQARFKQLVIPGDKLDIYVDLIEKIDNANYLKGKILVNGKVALQIKFQVASISH